ncbi:MAG: hypothetical protein JWM48_2632 [Mycobacterium sp.]|jgi:hypothetical protein|nr:hypothetical protein [Mycobacterium sp.]
MAVLPRLANPGLITGPAHPSMSTDGGSGRSP